MRKRLAQLTRGLQDRYLNPEPFFFLRRVAQQHLERLLAALVYDHPLDQLGNDGYDVRARLQPLYRIQHGLS